MVSRALKAIVMVWKEQRKENCVTKATKKLKGVAKEI